MNSLRRLDNKQMDSKRIHYSERFLLLTMEKEAAACSNSPTRPISVKYLPEQMPSSSGDTTSSDTADSSRTFEEMFWKSKIKRWTSQVQTSAAVS